MGKRRFTKAKKKARKREKTKTSLHELINDKIDEKKQSGNSTNDNDERVRTMTITSSNGTNSNNNTKSLQLILKSVVIVFYVYTYQIQPCICRENLIFFILKIKEHFSIEKQTKKTHCLL